MKMVWIGRDPGFEHREMTRMVMIKEIMIREIILVSGLGVDFVEYKMSFIFG